MIHLDLFSGIGGFALAVDEVFPEIEHIFCEIDPYCQALLKRRFPGATIFGDIRELTANSTNTGVKNLREWKDKVFLVTAGVPCQPASQAGKRRGTKDDRWLWPEAFRVIREMQPKFAILENVRGILSLEGGLVFKSLLTEMENIGYETRAYIIPAVAVNAPHRRDRVWFVANRKSVGERGCASQECSFQERKFQPRESARSEVWGKGKGCISNARDTQPEGLQDRNARALRTEGTNEKCERPISGRLTSEQFDQNWLEVATDFCGIYDGLSIWMDRHFDKIITGGIYGSRNKEMQVLFKAIQSPEIWEAIGGLYEMDGEKILLETVCQLQKRIGEQKRIYVEGKAITEEEMRVLPEYEWIRRSSQRRGHYEQLARKLINLVQELSYEFALEIVEAGFVLWSAYSATCSREVVDGLKLSKAKHRVERLKALGNSIVPQVAIEILKGIKYAKEL